MSLAPAVGQLREPTAWHFQSGSRGRTRGSFSSALLLRRSIITNEIKSRNLRLVAGVPLALVILALAPETPPFRARRRRGPSLVANVLSYNGQRCAAA